MSSRLTTPAAMKGWYFNKKKFSCMLVQYAYCCSVELNELDLYRICITYDRNFVFSGERKIVKEWKFIA